MVEPITDPSATSDETSELTEEQLSSLSEHDRSRTLASKAGSYTATRPLLSRDDTAERRALVEKLCMAGVGRLPIRAALAKRYNTSRHRSDALIAECRTNWAEEERENRPHYKAAAIRRLMGHISASRREKNWTAVAQFERLLSDVQGTREPLELNLNIDARVTEALVHVIADMSSEQVLEYEAEWEETHALAARARAELPPTDARASASESASGAGDLQ